ncbi:hypothetical protein DOTSEDRAFT_71832 [Dothistroma septosporum NZE10]|uniref:Cas1p 10 TM acyl transferase domain-containing protein n=1 Tax=Dothistroma septosporum (strain NZE10 / CBS 128990) TaxID=675120 RepID=N1PLE2_DOTSN|nr:hypothetical protein DOTSEDRAFT_71832 [Dothistroma septosporum NZE10]
MTTAVLTRTSPLSTSCYNWHVRLTVRQSPRFASGVRAGYWHAWHEEMHLERDRNSTRPDTKTSAPYITSWGMKLNALAESRTPWYTGLWSLSYGWAIYPVVLLAAILFNHLLLDDDPHKCQALTRSGHWYQDKWLVPRCDTAYHGSGEIRDCANGENRKIVFAGDLQIQGIYWGIVQRLDSDLHIPEVREQLGKDLHFSKDNIEVEFIWDPYLNGTKVIHRVEDLRDGKSIKPMMTLVGAGRSFVDRGEGALYAKAVERLASIAYSSGNFPRKAAGSRDVFTARDGPGDLLLFAPAETPFNHDGNKPDLAPIEEANFALSSAAEANDAISIMWSFSNMTEPRKKLYANDGINVSGEVSRRRADVLLNLRCNARVGRYDGFIHKGICCGVWKRNWIQTGFLTNAFVILPLAVLADLRFSYLSDSQRSVVRAICAVASIVALQYVADRTHVFEQVQRLPLQLSNLLSMIFITTVVGLATLRRCRPARAIQPGENKPHQPYLPRDQTDEWKGWMQALIIIYHYNMAWRGADWFWEIIRLTVASYLFLTGFGHTVYFLQKKDFSAKRFINVMVRTNLLPVTLAYVMRTRWVLYYYMALSTFWYCVLYVTMAVKKDWNASTPLLLVKMFVSAFAVHTFLNTKDLPETVVKMFKITCRMSFDAGDFFHHRVDQDQYIVYVGMLVAMLYVWVKDVLSSDERQNRSSRAFRKAFPILKYFIIALATIAFVYYFYWTNTTLDSTTSFSKLQPYLTITPILTFTILRNAHPVLRNWHSAALAWLGRYSGEMYVMQDHLWLAVDQESVLRTGFFHGDDTVWGDRWRDLVLITPLYLIACSIAGDATGIIAEWFIKEDEPAQPVSREKPITEVEMGLLAGGITGADDATVLTEKFVHRPSILQRAKEIVWPGKARGRALRVLFALWLMNMVYT